jgi:hypothetical protein
MVVSFDCRQDSLNRVQPQSLRHDRQIRLAGRAGNPGDFDLDPPIDPADLADRCGGCLDAMLLHLYRMLRHREFKAVAAIGFHRSYEVLAENFDLHDSQATFAVEKMPASPTVSRG